MIETNASVHQADRQAQLRARLAQAAITLGRQQAIKAVKRALAAQGLKPQHIPMREIAAAARDYLAAHPELIAEAKPIIEQWRTEGFFGKRAALIAERNSQDLHNARRPDPQGLSLCESHAQNGAAR